MFKRLLFPARLSASVASFLLLLARVCIGLMFLNHGMQKWLEFGEMSSNFPDPTSSDFNDQFDNYFVNGSDGTWSWDKWRDDAGHGTCNHWWYGCIYTFDAYFNTNSVYDY